MPIDADKFENEGKDVAPTPNIVDVMDQGQAYTTAELAEILGVANASVNQRLKRAVEKGTVQRKKVDGKIYHKRV